MCFVASRDQTSPVLYIIPFIDTKEMRCCVCTTFISASFSCKIASMHFATSDKLPATSFSYDLGNHRPRKSRRRARAHAAQHGAHGLGVLCEAKRPRRLEGRQKSRGFVVRGAIGKALAVCVLPNTYMNKSGSAAVHYIKSMKAAGKAGCRLRRPRFAVRHDENFVRPRIRRAQRYRKHCTRSENETVRARTHRDLAGEQKNAIQKPQGEKDVEKFILGEFSSAEFAQLKDIFKRSSEAIEGIILEGREKR